MTHADHIICGIVEFSTVLFGCCALAWYLWSAKKP